jgi:hypothetical protein
VESAKEQIMKFLTDLLTPFNYSAIDTQIEKFRQLADEYKQANIAYYGEYLSSILFDGK